MKIKETFEQTEELIIQIFMSKRKFIQFLRHMGNIGTPQMHLSGFYKTNVIPIQKGNYRNPIYYPQLYFHKLSWYTVPSNKAQRKEKFSV